MNPLLGNPLKFYEESVVKYDESYKKAAKAHKKAAKDLMELTNKQKCHELDQLTSRNKQSKASESMTPIMKV